ncbi:unnamed protein product [Lactuca virosa]|uniref:Uncharacterized protein n=1 Tax=Lactuca virosa TaxID=75947 RepID=A0AAU9LEI1_9ASTR|nr:unnamed protein product [Lactuca virosa]
MFKGSKKYTKNIATRTVVEIVNKLRKIEDEKTIDENVEKEKRVEGDEIQKKQTKKLMKQDESVLKTLQKKTTQEIRQNQRLQKTKTKKSMKQDKSVFKTPEKKTTQEIRQSPRIKMIEYKKSVTPIKVDDSLVKKESDEKNKPGTCKTTVLPHLLGKTPMRESDWCGFITNCLKMSKMTWDETDRGNYYCGPLLVLLDYEMMVKREKAELKSGDFGTLEWNDVVIENDEESDTDENEDMKLDELVFKAKKNYKKLVNDKMKFGKLIGFSTTKFIESDELKDMKKIFEQEFIYKTQNEDDAKSDRNEDEEKSDENLNEHEIKNQPIMVTPGNLYNDPIVHEIADSIQCILNFDDYDDFENEGDESSEDEHMKKEIKDEKLDEGESYDSEETECDNNILGIEDDEDKKKRSRKKIKKTITEAIFSL